MTPKTAVLKLDGLHIRPRSGSPIPDCVFSTLPEGKDTAFDIYWQLQLLKPQARYPEAAATWQEILRIRMERIEIPVHVYKEDSEWIVASGELGVLAAMHGGAQTLPCIIEQGKVTAVSRGPSEAPGVGDLDARIADFAGWLRARPQPPGFQLADAAVSLIADLERSLSAGEIWTMVFGKHYDTMPSGWKPLKKDRKTAAVLALAQRARCHPLTIRRLLRISALPTQIRQLQPDLSARKLRIICSLRDEKAQREVAALIARRPLSTRQLQKLVTACNKGMSVTQALASIDREGSSPIEEAASLIQKLVTVLNDLSLPDLRALALTAEWRQLAEKVKKMTR